MLCWHLLIYLLLGGTAFAVDLVPEYAEAREGSDAELPCSLQRADSLDKVSMVVWHKGNEETALYKYDMKGTSGQHWADPSVGDRYFLRLLDGERALLTISFTKLSDEAIYHCRVDFNRSPTRYTHVNLTVVGEWNSLISSGCFIVTIKDFVPEGTEQTLWLTSLATDKS
ncbi:hypothetical protein ILUMI_11872 [Ignelater luminosus]|uniref:Ig-like domain-containing protein n=1 Tax=Ignelater luminosus TaxID=2038154 RepID=A0A8K0GCV1_IGNLU|nr:hypothetical protein ILUMI_11872 [Ignelater luminosus]